MGKQKKPKKPKTSKKRKKRGKQRPRGGHGTPGAAPEARKRSIPAQRAELEMALAAGRTRRAVGLARLLGEEDGIGRKELVLIADTYTRHVTELLDRGHRAKAVQTFARIEADHPEWLVYFSDGFRVRLELLGSSATLLADYEDSTEIRVVVGGGLRSVLDDVRCLATHPHLPDTHVLKQQAHAIHRAWAAVEAASPEAPGLVREMKRAVGRRSPLVDWRLFVQAVADHYAGRTEAAEQALARVSPQGAVAPLAAILRDLNAGRAPEGCGGHLVAAAMSGDGLKARLSEIDGLIAQRQWKDVVRALARLPKEQADMAERPALQRQLGAGYVAHAGKQQPLYMIEDGQLPLGGRAAVLTFMASMGFDEPDDWEAFFETQGGQLTPCERALVCDRIARLLGEGSAPGPVFGGGRGKQGFREAEAWWDRSVKAKPLRSTFQNWHKTASRFGHRPAEKVMERWHRAFPEEERPLRALVDSCRARGVFQKAAGYFRQLDRVAGGRPEVETLRAFIAADDIVRHLRAGRERRAREAVENLAAFEAPAGEADAFTQVLRRVLAAILEMRTGDPDAALAQVLSIGHPLLVATIARVCLERQVPEAHKVITTVESQSEDADLMAADFHRLTRVRDPIWGAQTVMFLDALVASLIQTTMASEALRDCLEHILRLDPSLAAPASFELANAMTANGIRRRDRLWPIFLCYRALVLRSQAIVISARWLEKRRRRILRCVRLAWQVASQQGNREFLSMIETMAERVRVDLDHSAKRPLPDHIVDQIVETEGNPAKDRLVRRTPLLHSSKDPRAARSGRAKPGGRSRSPASPRPSGRPEPSRQRRRGRPPKPREAPPDQPSFF